MVAVASGERVPDPNDDDRMALSCYARAMDHVGVMSDDPVFEWVDRVILDLHFDACYFQKDQDPGQYRRQGIEVTRPGGGPPAYVGPPFETVPELMREVVEWLGHGDLDAHVAVRAAMAHLHLVSVHPFRDGNGRVSRIVQSLVLAREGLLAPEFVSIEEYLGFNTERITQRCKRFRVGRTSPSATPVPGSTSACRLISSRLGDDSISSPRPVLDGRCSRTWWRSEGGQTVSSSRSSRACSMALIVRHIFPKPTSLRRRRATTSDGCWMPASWYSGAKAETHATSPPTPCAKSSRCNSQSARVGRKFPAAVTRPCWLPAEAPRQGRNARGRAFSVAENPLARAASCRRMWSHNVRAAPYLRAVTKKFREVRRALSEAGWTKVRQAGSHETWRSPAGAISITVRPIAACAGEV